MRCEPFRWFLLAALCAAMAGLAEEQTFDEGFENGLGKFTVESWRGAPPEQLTDAVVHGGTKAVQLTGGAGANNVTTLWLKNPAMKLLPGEQYTVSIWAKTENAANVQLKVVVPDGVELKGTAGRKLTGTNDWTKLEQTFTVSKKAQPKSIGLWMTGPGKLWADDFALKGKTGAEWKKRIEIDATGVNSEAQFKALLAANGLKENGYVNWFTGRWPYISFIGGMAMCNRSEDLEFFYEKPFKWRTEVLDYVMEDGGNDVRHPGHCASLQGDDARSAAQLPADRPQRHAAGPVPSQRDLRQRPQGLGRQEAPAAERQAARPVLAGRGREPGH